MADSTEAAAELRISRVKAPGGRSLAAVVPGMPARCPGSVPAMVDGALSTLSPKVGR